MLYTYLMSVYDSYINAFQGIIYEWNDDIIGSQRPEGSHAWFLIKGTSNKSSPNW